MKKLCFVFVVFVVSIGFNLKSAKSLSIIETFDSKHLFSLKYQKIDSNNIAKLKNLEIKDLMTKETIQVIGLELIELQEQDISINISKDVNFDGCFSSFLFL